MLSRSPTRSIRARAARGGARLTRTGSDIVRALIDSTQVSNMVTNPLKLNIVLPVSKKNHIGQSKPLSRGDITGMALVIDGNPDIVINFVGTAFGLDGLAQYADLTPGEHTLSVAVITKAGQGQYTKPEPFTIVDGVADAPVITLV